jgi:hypothetical protein
MTSVQHAPPVLHDVPQRSEAWFTLRCGRLTASRAYDMLPRLRTTDPTARRDYLWQLVQEQLTGRPHERKAFVTAAMRRGLERGADRNKGAEHGDAPVVRALAARAARLPRPGDAPPVADRRRLV